MRSVEGLSKSLVQTWNIPAKYVIGHSDVAPDRKQDPGERFDWQRLAAAGVGIMPGEKQLSPGAAAQRPAGKPERFVACRDLLGAVGYDGVSKVSSDKELECYIMTFQRHWLPTHLSGLADDETLARLAIVAGMMV